MIVVRPVRFTDDVPAMRAFLEILGLQPRIESQSGSWLDLTATHGMIGLHEAARSVTGGRPGETRLSFEVADANAVAERLRAHGYADATAVDESYGRIVTVTDPLGAELQLDERQDDLYGYRAHGVELGSEADRLAVVPVRFTDDADGYHRFLTALGLTGEPAPGGYAVYALADRGFVGVHHVYDGTLPIVDGTGASVQLTLATDGDLDAIQQRLETAGYPVTRTDADWGSFLETTDPDGQSVQVHPWPAE
jgi:predicted enzyme related to lactoylglutathione lyase